MRPTDDIYNLATMENGADGAPNKEIPSAPVSTLGFARQGLSYQAFNYIVNNHALWLAHLLERLDNIKITVGEMFTGNVETGIVTTFNTQTQCIDLELQQATENVIGGGEISTFSEAVTGQDNTTIMTPLRVRQLIDVADPDTVRFSTAGVFTYAVPAGNTLISYNVVGGGGAGGTTSGSNSRRGASGGVSSISIGNAVQAMCTGGQGGAGEGGTDGANGVCTGATISGTFVTGNHGVGGESGEIVSSGGSSDSSDGYIIVSAGDGGNGGGARGVITNVPANTVLTIRVGAGGVAINTSFDDERRATNGGTGYVELTVSG